MYFIFICRTYSNSL